jgi:signal transduction histidine kinase/DNA-binding response OmpR family regulator
MQTNSEKDMDIDLNLKKAQQKETQEKIFAEKFKLLHENLLVSTPANFLCGTIVYIVLNKERHSTFILVWYVAVILIALYRLGLFYFYRHRPQHNILHLYVFIFGTIITALSWGIVGSLLMPQGHLVQQMIIVVIIAGITAGGIQTLDANLLASLICVILSVLPLSIWFLLQNNTEYLILAVSTMIYLLSLIVIAWRAHNRLEQTLRLSYENLNLIGNLSLLSKDLEEKSIKLQEALALSASASRAKSVFVANMSHELRTPLNAIIGYSEMLAEETEEAGLSHYTTDINKVINSAKHLLSLIKDVLDLSKIEAGKMEVFLGDVNIEVVVNDLKSIITPLIEKNNNVFQLHIGKIGTMHTDDMRLRQILLNLLSNAGKFTKDGTISLDINPLLMDDEWVQFSVTDTGIGMPADELERLFQAFSQVDSSSTRKFGGTGLGLYLTRLFCEMLGGAITVKSTYGKGSTFTITLPLKSKETVSKNYLLGQSVNISTTTPLSTKSVLIIDDDINIHKDIENILKTSNYTVLHAFNGEEGLNLIRMHQPNVIILDIIMPVMDGLSMLNTLKSEPGLAEIPVILMCINSEEGLGFALGIVDHIRKPVDIKQLIEKINHIISDTEGDSILIVDDDAYAREIMQRAVKKAGKKSISVTNGKEAIEYLQQHIPPLILLDLLMPEMDGFTVMHLMQQNETWRTIPVIVITAKTLTKEEYNMLTKFKKIVLQKDTYTQKKLVSVICEQILRILAPAPPLE